MTMEEELSKVFEWDMITCNQFDATLYYNHKIDIYKSDSKIIDKNDPRLLEYIKVSKNLKPINWSELHDIWLD